MMFIPTPTMNTLCRIGHHNHHHHRVVATSILSSYASGSSSSVLPKFQSNPSPSPSLHCHSRLARHHYGTLLQSSKSTTSVLTTLSRLRRHHEHYHYHYSTNSSHPLISFSGGCKNNGEPSTTTTSVTKIRQLSSRPSSSTSSNGNEQPKLAYEWISNGEVHKNDDVVDGTSDTKEEVIVFLHGLLGNSKNLRTPAKKLTKKIPHLKALLLDIRGHGNSSTTTHAQPHDFQSCVQDIIETLTPLGLVGTNSPRTICGHSLGGRIALQYSHHLCSLNTSTTLLEPPKQTWVLDSVPGRADPSVHNVLRAISSLSTPIPSKKWLVDTLTKEYKMDKGVALWIATNLKAGNGDDKKSFDWVFDLNIANELVDNFSNQNFAKMIDEMTQEDKNNNPDDTTNLTRGDTNSSSRTGTENTTVHLVMAGKNKLWSEEIVSELKGLSSFEESNPSSLFRMHTLEKAGHWVHVDDCDGLVNLMLKGYMHK
mmetsp:Transcript_8261/g.15454  ORF Transcript_8261/g.15454 Transcript_8261/m.15454 type:complete len:481 (-) Transcript_8261:39-1481(-)